jgi:DNA-binding MarR family transcriptional regulator
MHLYCIGRMQRKTHDTDTGPLIDTAACNCLAIRQAARHLTQLYERHMAESGLSANQYSILAKLSRFGPQSINALAAAMVMDRTTTGRAIRPLARDKLVAIDADAGGDARVRLIRLTALGEKRLKAAAAGWTAAQREFERAFGAGEAAALRAALGRVVALGA